MTLNTTSLVSSVHQQMLTTGHKSYLSLRKLLQVLELRRHPQGDTNTKKYKHQQTKCTKNDVLVLMLQNIFNSLRMAPRCETCRNLLRFMYDLYVILCICW